MPHSAIEEEPSSVSLPLLMALETPLSTFDIPLSILPEEELPDMLEEPLCVPDEEECFEDELLELQPARRAAASARQLTRDTVFFSNIQTPFRPGGAKSSRGAIVNCRSVPL